MHRIVVDLGPAGKPSEASLPHALAERAMVPTYVAAAASFADLGAARGASFRDVEVTMRGGVFDEFWRGVREPAAWSSTASHCVRPAVEAVVRRRHGPTPQDAAAVSEAFADSVAYWEQAMEALGITATRSNASPHCVYSLARMVAAAARELPFVTLRHASLEGVSFVSSNLPGGLSCGTQLPVGLRLAALEESEHSAAQLAGSYDGAKPIAMRLGLHRWHRCIPRGCVSSCGGR